MKKDLRDGLILRSLSEGISSDYENLAQFYVEVFKDAGDEDTETFPDWIADLTSGKHPTMGLDDVWVVVDPAQADRIVSALLLIPQVWCYEGIEIPVGKVELVATHPDYRRRGLIRELMTVAHQRSAELGHVMQCIAGIEHYYRRFGYGMAINLGADAQLPMTSIPKLKPDQEPKFTLRQAITDDIANLQKWEAYEYRDGGLKTQREPHHWDFDINHRHLNTPYALDFRIIVDTDGQDVGFVGIHMDKYYRSIFIHHFIVGDPSSYLESFDDVLRAIQSIADEFYADLPADIYPTKIRFDNGLSTALKALTRKTDGGMLSEQVYAWYIRVEDIPSFIKLIAPVLEKRLAGSGANRFTGELKIGFYELNGIVLTFEDGKMTNVVSATIKQFESDTAMPYHTFLNILFGHRDWRELGHVLPEVNANRKADLLLSILFPKMRNQIGDGVA